MRAFATTALISALAGCAGEVVGTLQPPDAPAPVDDAPPIDAEVAGPGTCRQVAHIGDSLTAATAAALTDAYDRTGATAQLDAFGGRAVLQKLAADPKTGKQAALDFRRAGFSGCWVVALGTNDTANVAAGASYTRAQSIDEMMGAIDPGAAARVLWVNAFTTRTTGFYASDNMRLYNDALEAARARWPNLRVFDWATVAAGVGAPMSDGIHHTAEGYAVRNAAIAGALELLER